MPQLADQIEPFLTYCLLQRQLTEGTVRNYRLDLHYFLKFLQLEHSDVRTCDQVHRKLLGQYVEFLSQRYKVRTIKRKISCLQSFYTYLEHQEIILDSPFRRFHLRMKEGHRQPNSLSAKEMEQFLRAVYRDPFAASGRALAEAMRNEKNPTLDRFNGSFFWCRDAAILELLFAVGFRVAELCSLRYSDFNPGAGSFHIIGKGNRERTLFVSDPAVLVAFYDYLSLRNGVKADHEYLFITRFREVMSPQSVRNLVEKYANVAGINKRITPHVFRHSFASLLIESGVDIKYVQDFLGHSSISTTQIYLHLSDESKRDVLAFRHPRQHMTVEETPASFIARWRESF